MRHPARLLALAVALSPGLVACGNPVVDKRIEALGPELEGVEEGPFHRPGQPCVLCHSAYEGVSPELSVGGTVFTTAHLTPQKQLPAPFEGAKVVMVDSVGESRTAVTNCIGNFFVTKEEWDPSFPLKVSITYTEPGTDPMAPPVEKAVTMESRVSRDGSCAGCHLLGERDQGSPGWVFLVEEQPGPDGAAGTADDVFPPFPPFDPNKCEGRLPVLEPEEVQ